MKICVMGGGYVGLVTAAGLSHLGHRVHLTEIDQARLAVLTEGDIPIHEPGLAELVVAGTLAGTLEFSGDLEAAIDEADVAMICVNTPPQADGSVDTTHALAAVDDVLAHAPDNLVVVMKSTVPVGTGDDLVRRIRDRGRGLRYVSNPEFLREGVAVTDFLSPDRIVIGGDDIAAIEVVARIYEPLDAPVFGVSTRAAELGKYAANAYLASRISFMNDLSRLCDASEVDVFEIERIIGSDERIGPHFLKAGLGWGGSCFPKDVAGLLKTAEAHGVDLHLVAAAERVNRVQLESAERLVLDAMRGSENAAVAVLGLSFKPHTDDVRESQAMKLVDRLGRAGLSIRAHDPIAIGKAREIRPAVEYFNDPYSCTSDVEAVVVATEWPQFRELDWARVGRAMSGRLLVDARNLLDPAAMSSLGFDYRSFGRTTAAGRAQATNVNEAELIQ